MLFTLDGNSIDCKALQPENAESSILVTLAGISIDCKALHP